MSTIMIACETLKEELEMLLKDPDEMDIVWMDGGLHTSPENLRDELQYEIDRHDGLYDEIILAYGFCGGGIENLESKSSCIIVPRVEDCISILLGGDCKRSQVNDRDKPLFLTQGWVRSMNLMEGINIRSIKDKYGDQLAKDLYREIFKGYCNIDIIDTGAYKTSDIDDDVAEIQEALELPCKTIGCDLVMMDRLLKRDWGDDFVIKKPGQKIERRDYY